MEAFFDIVVAWSWLAYLMLFLVVLVESAGAPIPALTMALVGGALAGQGRLDFWLVFLAVVGGGTLGGVAGYGLGHLGGRPLVERFGRFIGLTPARIEIGENFFHRHGAKALVIGRYLPVLCFAGGLLSGMARLPLRRFFFYNFLSMALWATSHLTLAFFFGRNLDTLMSLFNRLGLALLIVLVLTGAGFYFVRRSRIQKTRALKVTARRQIDKQEHY